jgi:hypothetical protein
MFEQSEKKMKPDLERCMQQLYLNKFEQLFCFLGFLQLSGLEMIP